MFMMLGVQIILSEVLVISGILEKVNYSKNGG